VAIAGGLTWKTHIYKALALGAPYFKIAGMARSPLAAAMVGKTIGRKIHEGKVPVYISRFGNSVDEIFITAPATQEDVQRQVRGYPPGGHWSIYVFPAACSGLAQLMTGNRKFTLSYMRETILRRLTKEAADVSGIPYIMDVTGTKLKRF